MSERDVDLVSTRIILDTKYLTKEAKKTSMREPALRASIESLEKDVARLRGQIDTLQRDRDTLLYGIVEFLDEEKWLRGHHRDRLHVLLMAIRAPQRSG